MKCSEIQNSLLYYLEMEVHHELSIDSVYYTTNSIDWCGKGDKMKDVEEQK